MGLRAAGLTDLARQTKHRAFVAYKNWRFPISLRLEPLHRRLYQAHPYVYDEQDFADLGLGPLAPPAPERADPIDRVIYTFWTGHNELTPNRQRNLDELRRLNEPLGIRVALVTPDNLSDFVVPEVPLSDLYESLHVVHRADYLRAYLLHVRGGGYSDIKAPASDWAGAFDRMDASPAWLSGDFKPSRYLTPAFTDRRLERLMRRTSPTHVFQCAFIARPATPLTSEWWTLLNEKVEANREALLAHPGEGRFGGPGYPLAWTSILGQIIDPLTVKYAPRVAHDHSLELRQTDYL